MSRKKSKADEFSAMADVHKILVHFDAHARARICASVEGKISAEAPKPRVRRKRSQFVGSATHDEHGNVIQ